MKNLAELLRQLDRIAAGDADQLNEETRELIEAQLSRAQEHLAALVTGERCAWCDRESGITHNNATHTICPRHKEALLGSAKTHLLANHH